MENTIIINIDGMELEINDSFVYSDSSEVLLKRSALSEDAQRAFNGIRSKAVALVRNSHEVLGEHNLKLRDEI
jgi:hypothetical protein